MRVNDHCFRKELYRRTLVSESPVHPLGIVPEEIVEKFPIERVEVVEEELFPIVREFLLYRPIEPLRMRIHLGRSWIGVIVEEVNLPYLFREVFREFTPVVGEDGGEGKWKDQLHAVEEFPGGKGGVGMRRPGEGDSRMHIGRRENIPPPSLLVFLEGIEGDDVPRICCLQSFRLSQDLFPIDRLHLSEVSDLLRKGAESTAILHESPDGRWFRTGKLVRFTEFEKRRKEFLLPEIGMFLPLSPDLSENRGRPLSHPLRLRGATLPVERFRLLPSLLPLFLPEEKRSPFRLRKGFEGRRQSMLLPKNEDPRLFQRLFRDHISVP